MTISIFDEGFVILTALLSSTVAAIKDPAWKHCMHNVHAFPGKWGSIKSPGFPNGINTQIQCSWVIQSNPGYKVKLAFHTLNMTGSRGNCYTQFVEVQDYKVGHSMGKFCGAKRPGDYVSFGYKVRFDLQGDTSGAKTKGFDLRYKATREIGGFKRSWAFSTKPTVKERRRGKPKAKPKSPNSKPRKPNGPPKVFGGPASRKQDEAGAPESTAETSPKGIAPTQQNQGKPSRAPSRAPSANRIGFRAPVARQPNRPVIYGANANIRAVDFGRSNVITQAPDTSEPILDYTIIAGIAAGGAVLLVVLIVVIKLCICDKSKRERSKNAPRDENVNRNVPGMSMVPIPGIIPAEYSNEEILKRNASHSRRQSWSALPPTMSHMHYPVVIDDPRSRRSVAAVSMPGRIASSRSRIASARSRGSRRSRSVTRRPRYLDEAPRAANFSRSRSLSYLPANMNGWVRVDDHDFKTPAPAKRSSDDSDFESSESDSYSESDSSRDRRRRASVSNKRRRKSRRRSRSPPPPYNTAGRVLHHPKGRDFDEGYSTSRKAASSKSAGKKNSKKKDKDRKRKRSRKYPY